MGHYLSEMLDPSPLFAIIKFEDELTLKKGESFMKDKTKFFKKNDKCYSVILHERSGNGWCYSGKWYEIHCINKYGGKYFKSVSCKEWLEYNKI